MRSPFYGHLNDGTGKYAQIEIGVPGCAQPEGIQI